MDVNGTRFHLLFGQDDWQPLVDTAISSRTSGLDWDDNHACIRLGRKLFLFPTPPGDKLPQTEDRRGAGQDRYGNWYWIAEDQREIRFLPANSRQYQHFWSASDLPKKCQSEAPEGIFTPVYAITAPK